MNYRENFIRLFSSTTGRTRQKISGLYEKLNGLRITSVIETMFGRLCLYRVTSKAGIYTVGEMLRDLGIEAPVSIYERDEDGNVIAEDYSKNDKYKVAFLNGVPVGFYHWVGGWSRDGWANHWINNMNVYGDEPLNDIPLYTGMQYEGKMPNMTIGQFLNLVDMPCVKDKYRLLQTFRNDTMLSCSGCGITLYPHFNLRRNRPIAYLGWGNGVVFNGKYNGKDIEVLLEINGTREVFYIKRIIINKNADVDDQICFKFDLDGELNEIVCGDNNNPRQRVEIGNKNITVFKDNMMVGNIYVHGKRVELSLYNSESTGTLITRSIRLGDEVAVSDINKQGSDWVIAKHRGYREPTPVENEFIEFAHKILNHKINIDGLMKIDELFMLLDKCKSKFIE